MSESVSLPPEVVKEIEAGPNGDERLNDEWKRRELFATRIALLMRRLAIEECARVCEAEAERHEQSIRGPKQYPYRDRAHAAETCAVRIRSLLKGTP